MNRAFPEARPPRFRTTEMVKTTAMRHVVYCPSCKTVIRVDPDQGLVMCTNLACRQQIQISNPTFQRGGIE